MPSLKIILCSLLLAAMWAPVASRAQVYKGVEVVKADLLADTGSIAPGKTFTVGLRLKMAPGWHTYWEYSGDAGLPTKIAWTLPKGFTAGPIQWPVPEKIDSPGDIVNYGYSNEVMLLTEITAPAQGLEGPIELRAKADWLACEELCIPGKADLVLNLSAGDSLKPDHADVFARYRALLPRVADAAGKFDGGALSFQKKGRGPVTVSLTGPPGKFADLPAFFPLAGKGVELEHPEAVTREPDGSAVHVAVPLLAGEPEVGGVFVFRGTAAPGRVAAYYVPASAAALAQMPGPSPSTVAAPLGGAAPLAGSGAGLWHFLLLGFVGGLILNVMPCVLPVISLKLFSFVKQANDDPARIWRMGVAYAAGVFAWFLGIAALVVALKAAGHEVGYSFHLQSPWFVLVLTALVFAFSLNLLGVFEITLPEQVNGALGEASQRNAGYGGAFFQGVLATVLGSACTAPFLGAALGFAFAERATVVFGMFAAIAAGMSLPFVLLAANPGWLRFLPRPGEWMERVKQATGFLMLATVLWLLSILGEQRGANAVVGAGVLLLTVGAAAWIRGAFVTLSSSSGRNWLLGALGLAFVCAGGFYAQRTVAQGSVARAGATGSFVTQLDAALRTNQPVFVDFTAAWCVNCKVNERAVLSREPVQRALKDANAAFLTADWTDGDPEITAILKKFGRAGVPLYVIYPADRTREAIILPELLTNQMVIDGLKSAAAGAPALAVVP